MQILFSVDRENRDTLYQLFYRVDDFLNRVDSYVKDIIRAKVPLLTLDELFEDTSEIKRDMTERMTVVMAGFGYVLRETLVVDLDPNPKVKASMNEIETEKRLRVAAYDEGEAKKIETVILGEAAAEEKYSLLVFSKLQIHYNFNMIFLLVDVLAIVQHDGIGNENDMNSSYHVPKTNET